MGKIKLNLVSGAAIEKPLICAFKANENEYIVLDDEMNGSMGLPIILVCKYIDNKLTKILDQGEWQTVKEYLKNIIAGGKIEFVNVGNELQADDIYYTQLTLPVPSFDALKGAYKVEDTVSSAPVETTPVTPEPTPTQVPKENKNLEETGILDLNLNNIPGGTPAAPTQPTDPVASPQQPQPAPAVPDIQIPIIENNQASVATPTNEVPSAPVADPTPVAPATPEVSSVNPTTPTPEAPTNAVNEINPTAPVVDLTPNPAAVSEPPVTPEAPIAPSDPVSVAAPTPENTQPDSRFKEQKEAFMQACENMFDALVQKFEKELENNK